MKEFLNDDFYLDSDLAVDLYHSSAEKQPIYDFQCLFSAQEASNEYDVPSIMSYLDQEPAVQALLLSFGAQESTVFSADKPKERFLILVKALERGIGSNVYIALSLALKRIFQIELPFTVKNAEAIWSFSNERLQCPEFKPKAILKRLNPDTLAFCNDPIEDLRNYSQLNKDPSVKTAYLPSFQADKALDLQSPGFPEYIRLLGARSNIEIQTIDDVINALEKRIAYFHGNACRLASHEFSVLPQGTPSIEKANKALKMVLSGNQIKSKQANHYQSLLLTALGLLYAKYDWVQHYHLEASRPHNHKLIQRYGSNYRIDAMNDEPISQGLNQLLEAQNHSQALPKTIISCRSIEAYQAAATVIPSYQSSGYNGKIQLVSATSFLEPYDVPAQLAIQLRSNFLSSSIGYASRSHSILGLVSHELFRRHLCNLLASQVEKGLYPIEKSVLRSLVEQLSIRNSKQYFSQSLTDDQLN